MIFFCVSNNQNVYCLIFDFSQFYTYEASTIQDIQLLVVINVPLMLGQFQTRTQYVTSKISIPIFAELIFFSTIDLLKAYTRIPVNPNDIKKTAVTTPFRLFEFPFMHEVSTRATPDRFLARHLPDRIADLKTYPRPTTVKGVSRFLGMINFYRRFISHAAKF